MTTWKHTTYPADNIGKLRKAPNVIDLTNQRYGHLIVLKRHGTYGTAATWWCRCDCGTERAYRSETLRHAGPTISCGCVRSTGKGSRPYYKTKHVPGKSSRHSVLKGYKLGAKYRGLSWELTEEDFDRLTSSDCTYCGIPPSTITKVSRNGFFVYNGIDRTDNTIGYTPENTVTCCGICNHAKRDMSQKDFLAWIYRLVLHTKTISI
jgi:hypothetical protein